MGVIEQRKRDKMYIPEYFKLYELFPEDFYNANKHRGNDLFWLIDDRVLWTLDQLRERYGPVYINNWYWGGNNQYGCFRPFDCEIGAEWSQHKFGRAGDPKFKEVDAEEIRQDILSNPWDIEFEHIACLEMNISWLHFDVRNWDKSKERNFKNKTTGIRNDKCNNRAWKINYWRCG